MRTFTAVILCTLLLSANPALSARTAISVTILTPLDGATVSDTLVVSGITTDATSVTILVDGGAPLPVNGLSQWDIVFEPGSLSEGEHTVTARAVGPAAASAEDQVSFTVVLASGAEEIFYPSSVDGTSLGGYLLLPAGFDPLGPPVPLVVVLHGGGGTGLTITNMANGAVGQEIDERGWIGIAPDGRRWGLADRGCPWETSAGYVDNPDPDVGPGEQDILDAIDWAMANYPVDPDRIYLTGSSMGGRGTYMIGLKNPDRFAAIAPASPAVDMFEIFARRPEPVACKEGMTGGRPGDSPFVDTMYRITSGRFLLENAYNLPVFHGHGLLDPIAFNVRDSELYLHGWNMTSDGSWNGCHPDTTFCFGHTPTLAELQARHPGGYDWAYLFTPVEHEADPRWYVGTDVDADSSGVPDPQDPGRLLGMMDFFALHSRRRSPDTVVYKSYTDQHRHAYWATLDISAPWLDRPGAVRAIRDAGLNALSVELVRAARATFDLDEAGLRVAAGDPLTVTLQALVEPAYDPALDATAEPLEPAIVLLQGAATSRCVRVDRDGAPVPPEMLVPDPARIEIGPLSLALSTTLIVQAVDSLAFDCDGDGFVLADGDCDDLHETARPGGVEICDGLDNDCSGDHDEGYDLDGDGAASCQDTCPNLSDPLQADADGDGIGDACEDTVVNANVSTDGASAARIDGSDLFVLGRSFGQCLGDPAYDGRGDLSRDGCVDGDDLALMAGVWGASISG